MKTSFKLMLLSASLGVATLASAQNVIRFYQGGKVGYKNKQTGEIVVQPNYTAGSEMMADNTALVLEGRKRGFINDKGEVIIPFMYDDASVFFDGLARVMKDGKHGYINRKNETVIPFTFDFADDFKNGIARVKKDGKFGWIDLTGKEAIALKYSNAFNFGDGLAPVRTDEGTWGYINLQGQFVLQPKYADAKPFNNGEALVKSGDQYMFIDKTGTWLRDMKNMEEEEASERERGANKK
jgi:hypothetical protein